MNKKNLLSSNEMKRIIGGAQPPSTTCSTTCDTGYYACCTRSLGLGQGAKCQCIPIPDTNTLEGSCDSGGPGHSSCSIE